ncbi:MAG: hypothetical protein Fur0035_14250 [Anaerolineales bacterium]
MPNFENFALALRALQEVQAEAGAELPARAVFPRLAEVLGQMGPIPPHSALLGVAGDGRPILLRMDQPGSGAALVLADRGSGKTQFLQSLARSTLRMNSPRSAGVSVLTDFPSEWQKLSAAVNVFPAYDARSAELLAQLAEWVERGGDGRYLLLLMDGLDSVLHFEDSPREDFLYLLRYGPRAGLWPVLTLNAARALRLPDWLALFRSRIFGRIADPALNEELTPLAGAPLNQLFPGAEFCLRQHSRWERFWLPAE